jgi:hypothetical protein
LGVQQPEEGPSDEVSSQPCVDALLLVDGPRADYRVAVASRGTDLGDSILTSNAALPVLGVPLQSAALMPNANMLFTDPQNIIFGVQRNVRIEQDRDIRSREIIIVLTARIGIQIEQEDAAAKVINLG